MTEPINPAEPTTPSAPVTPAVETKPTDTQADDSSLLGGAKESEAEGTPKDSEGKVEDVNDVIPEVYDIKFKDTQVDKETLDVFTPIFKELGLSNPEAQKLADAYAPILAKSIELAQKESMDYFNKIKEEWREKGIKELGPDKEKKLAECAKVRNKFGDDELKQLLDETGIGNHPAVIRMFRKIGEVTNEDKLIDPKTKTPIGGQTLEKSLYSTVDAKQQ
jgi:hypothetical protein